LVVFFTSTLFPITPPRIAPAAPPITAPFTLSLLVTAPITAPAPAPIAASRFVCFSTVVVGAFAVVVPLLVPLELVLLDFDAVELLELFFVVVVFGALAVVLLRIADVPVAPFVCSAAVTESSGVVACAARPRSLFSDGSAGFSLLHAADRAIAGMIINTLSPFFITPPRLSA